MVKSKGKILSALLRGLCGALCAVPVILLIDFAVAATQRELRVRYTMLLAAAVFMALIFLAVKFPKCCKAMRIFIYAAYIPVLLWFVFYLCAPYRSLDKGDKAGLFADKNVMIIVPHEDDELNIMGGAIQEYLSYGSTVRVVFATNGDYYGLDYGRERIAEAINVLSDIGVPEENIIFLGYSDSMMSEQGYFYNDEDENALAYSANKDASATYGIEGHPAFNDENSFTRLHFFEDIKACILQYTPDTLICVDHDGHRDHKATSLLFERAMGEILREEANYKPLVLKGMAYSTAYHAEKEFSDNLNIASTHKPYMNDYMEENHAYLWQDRVRIPVSADSLSRSVFGCKMWDAAMFYKTQNLIDKAELIITGDKVLWPRPVTSLTYSASIRASSGDAARLNDFCLGDSFVTSENTAPMRGVWCPSAKDDKPQINVSLAAPSDITLLKFYDAQSFDDNVLKLTVEFDSGNKYELGPLDPGGAATILKVDEKNVSSFVISIVAREGESAGLTEIEAYKNAPEYGLKYIKLTDAGGNFVYDYIIDPSGQEEFSIYALGAAQELNGDNYTATCSNPKCSAEIADGKLCLVCPPGASTELCISAADGSVSDSVYVHNPLLQTSGFWMKIESQALGKLLLPYGEYSNIWKTLVFLHNKL